MKFPINGVTSCPILKFWDFDRIMAVGFKRLKRLIIEMSVFVSQ
jgi:hypothetical protein